MKKYYLQTQIYPLLLLLVCVTSCNGQVKTNLPIDSVSEPEISTSGQPKLIKTQGTDQNQNVQCGLLDKAGNLWFGTSGEGVYRFDPSAALRTGSKSFTNFTVKDGLSNNTVWSILEDKTGIIWFGTADGICRYDPSAALRTGSKTITRFPIAVTNFSYLYPDDSPNNNAWPKNAVLSMLQDKTGKFWFGTGDGVYRYDGKSFTHFLHNDGVINNNNLHLKGAESILEDRAGNIWFGGRSWDEEGVCRFDGKSIINFKPDGEPWVRPLLEDKAGNIWFGSRNHMVYRYDPSAALTTGSKPFTSFAEKEITGWVFSMAEDKAGNLWFSGGKNGGVSCYDGKSFKHFTTEDGLINNSVWCIVEDSAGNIWFGTKNTGLCRYDPSAALTGSKTFTNFSE